ncbi:MAG: restriction endonuclease [Deltaproteobacteria bacterium]|nr:restriction endonuclease [Deltaproteobacteria bacterium]
MTGLAPEAAVALAGLAALVPGIAYWRSDGRRLRRFFRRHPAYLKALQLKRSQLIYVDDYGDVVYEEWERELGSFIERKLPDSLRHVPPERLDRLVASAPARGEPSDEAADPDPLAFEARVARAFVEAGWQARTTRRSGDQGADVVAERGELRVVVQCKRQGQPVGNGAVQEAVAARHFYRADLAIVVATSSFTRSARQLADSAGVDLVHAHDLSDWIEGQSNR